MDNQHPFSPAATDINDPIGQLSARHLPGSKAWQRSGDIMAVCRGLKAPSPL